MNSGFGLTLGRSDVVFCLMTARTRPQIPCQAIRRESGDQKGITPLARMTIGEAMASLIASDRPALLLYSLVPNATRCCEEAAEWG